MERKKLGRWDDIFGLCFRDAMRCLTLAGYGSCRVFCFLLEGLAKEMDIVCNCVGCFGSSTVPLVLKG